MFKFKAGDKFIIELEKEHDCSDVPYYKIKGLFMTINETQLMALDRYSEITEKEKEAYEKGYSKAMCEAQQAVKTFRVMNNKDREKYFDGKYTIAAILDTFDPREIVEKLQLYEKEKSKIRVGDVVKVENSGGYLGKAIVTYVDKYEKEIYVVFAGGSAGEITDGTRLRKTGEHFEEVEKLLAAVKHEPKTTIQF